MAHIPDGVLSAPVLAAGAAGAVVALAWSLRRLDEETLPEVAVVAALFFVAGLVSVPVGPTAVHLLLAGLMALVIGRATVAAVFVGLVLQAVFFGFGGLLTLGVNTVNIALPGVLWALALAPLLRRARSPAAVAAVGAAAAALSAASTAALVAAALALSDPAYLASAGIVLVAYLPLVAGEALIAGFACAFLARVSPDVLRIGTRGQADA